MIGLYVCQCLGIRKCSSSHCHRQGHTKLPDYVPVGQFPKPPMRDLFTAASADTLNLLGKCLVYEPRKRISALDVRAILLFVTDWWDICRGLTMLTSSLFPIQVIPRNYPSAQVLPTRQLMRRMSMLMWLFLTLKRRVRVWRGDWLHLQKWKRDQSHGVSISQRCHLLRRDTGLWRLFRVLLSYCNKICLFQSMVSFTSTLLWADYKYAFKR